MDEMQVNYLDTASTEHLARRQRNRFHTAVRRVTKHTETKSCGIARLGNVQIRSKNGGAYYSGLAHCGMIWLCPTCAARIGARRALEVTEVLKRHKETGGIALFLTFTIRHNETHSLDYMVTTLRHSLSRFVGNGVWRVWKNANGFIGSIRTFEITPGGTSNSPHPHIHMLVLLDRKSITGEELAKSIYDLGHAWTRIIDRAAPDLSPPWSSGLRIEMADLDDSEMLGYYVTKVASVSTANELIRGDRKTKNGSYWEVAMKAASGDKRAFAMWQAYEECTFNLVKMAWSRNLRKTYGLIKEKTDSELAENEDIQGELVIELDDDQAKMLRGSADCLKVVTLEYAEKGGAEAVLWFLERIRLALVPLKEEIDAQRWLYVNKQSLANYGQYCSIPGG